jgi:hypothetical protein
MADQADIKDKLRRYFLISGTIKIHTNGVVDVAGSVSLNSLWRKLPVQFGEVSGSFTCASSHLTTLEGVPHTVGDTFDCSSNSLTSLAYAPHHVGKHFRCSHNQLTSLQHAPSHVQGYFNCAKNLLTDLVHAPTHVQDNFTCHGNPLTTLNGLPDHVGGTIWLTWDPQLPLLRALTGRQVQFMNITPESEQVAGILNKYMGSGKPGAIRAAAELIRAGFKDNARW